MFSFGLFQALGKWFPHVNKGRERLRHLHRRAVHRPAALERLEDRTLLSTIVVTGTGDTIAVDGVVTLREAITSINAGANVNADVAATGTYGTSDTINFNIPGTGVRTISPTTELPAITKLVLIDGYSQPGTSVNTLANADNAVLLIQLDGSNVSTPSSNGLTLNLGSNSSVVRGLVITRFTRSGILINDNSTRITGNFIGTDASGMIAMGNSDVTFDGSAGIRINNGVLNVIGGPSPDQRNIIAGNNNINLKINGGSTNKVFGNFIGVNATGIGIVLGSGASGIEITGGQFHQIGEAAPEFRNIIGGNKDGIEINGQANLNKIQGNYIGMGSDGATAVGNRSHGVVLHGGQGSGSIGNDTNNVTDNLIGDPSGGGGNLIANNGAAGVAIFGNSSNRRNDILRNSILSNGRNSPATIPGIDLTPTGYPNSDGVTLNDAGDTDLGPNGLQNYPVLTSVTGGSGGVTITGFLNSKPNTTYRLEFFTSAVASETGFGEGATFIGSLDVVTDPSGSVGFSKFFTTPPVPVQVVTATASGSDGTSEFSAGLQPPDREITIGDMNIVEGDAGTATASFNIGLSAASTLPVMVTYSTANGSATAPTDYIAVPPTVLTFAAGETSKTISVPVNGDTDDEANEMFFVNLSAPVNATIADGQGVGTIINDDTRMYRAFNRNADLHVFMTSLAEFKGLVGMGYYDESSGRPGFDVVTPETPGSVPLHRLYNPNGSQHYLTYDGAESDFLVSQGWKYEKDEGNIFVTQAAGTTEIFRMYNVNNGDHVYTADPLLAVTMQVDFPGIWVQHASLGFAFAAPAQAKIYSAPATAAVVAMEEPDGEATSSDDTSHSVSASLVDASVLRAPVAFAAQTANSHSPINVPDLNDSAARLEEFDDFWQETGRGVANVLGELLDENL